MVKNPPANVADTGNVGSIPELGRSPAGRNGNHSSILAWKIPWIEEPGRLQPMGSQKESDTSDLLGIYLDMLTIKFQNYKDNSKILKFPKRERERVIKI